MIPSLRPLSPLLNQYKSLQKQLASDVSLTKIRGMDMAAIYRDIERWIGEAKVVATAVHSEGVLGSSWSRRRQEAGAEPENEEYDDMEDSYRERWALEQVAEALCERGALVPSSKK
jgi:ribosomal biogenesis protein LAS1